MTVNAWFYGTFRQLAVRQRAVELADGASLGDLIELLTQEYGLQFSQEISRVEEYFIMLNGNYCALQANRDKPLHDGDVVAFIPIMVGG